MAGKTEGATMDEKLARMPAEPGVYLFLDARGAVIYVGKAASLRARVRSYFRGGDERPSVPFLVARCADIDWIVTPSDKDAVLLENTLIKKHKPRYNLRLVSDATYLSLRIDPKAEWPRFEIVRKRRRDGAVYLGPYDSAKAAHQTLQFVHRVFPLRQCKDSVLRNRTRPCILYDIGRCPGPCCLPVDRARYDEVVQSAIRLLSGRRDDIVALLKQRMDEHSRRLEFEKAGVLRDEIAAIHRTTAKQRVALAPDFEADVLGVWAEAGRVCFALLSYRNGLLNDSRVFLERDNGLPVEEMANAFISQYYDDVKTIPARVLTGVEPSDAAMLQAYLEELRGGPCEVRRPQRGEMARVADIARDNARERLRRAFSAEQAAQEALENLQVRLRLPHPPARIECYDISTFQGQATVGSRVAFVGGAPSKADYRHYKISSVEGTDDFAAMREVLTRRFRHVVEEGDEAPDLVIIDGGIGQLNVAVAVFEDLGIAANVPVVGLAKNRLKETPQGARRARMIEQEGAEEVEDEGPQRTGERQTQEAPGEAHGGEGGEGELLREEEDGESQQETEGGPEAEGEQESGGGGGGKLRTAERIFLPGRKNPIILKRNDSALHLVQRLRDEAHRFAITFHKKTRSKSTIASALDAIPGVGPTRRKALLRHFGSLTRLRDATPEQIAAAPGISPALAQTIADRLKPDSPAATRRAAT